LAKDVFVPQSPWVTGGLGQVLWDPCFARRYVRFLGKRTKF